jgi:hypothetical protein
MQEGRGGRKGVNRLRMAGFDDTRTARSTAIAGVVGTGDGHGEANAFKRAGRESPPDRLEPSDASPTRKGLGRVNGRPKTIGLQGETFWLTVPQIACLAAVAHGVSHCYGIRQAYNAKHTTMLYSLSKLHAENLVTFAVEGEDPHDPLRHYVQRGGWPPARLPYRLTGKGEAVVRVLREEGDRVFAECEGWLRGRAAKNPQ